MLCYLTGQKIIKAIQLKLYCLKNSKKRIKVIKFIIKDNSKHVNNQQQQQNNGSIIIGEEDATSLSFNELMVLAKNGKLTGHGMYWYCSTDYQIIDLPKTNQINRTDSRNDKRTKVRFKSP